MRIGRKHILIWKGTVCKENTPILDLKRLTNKRMADISQIKSPCPEYANHQIKKHISIDYLVERGKSKCMQIDIPNKDEGMSRIHFNIQCEKVWARGTEASNPQRWRKKMPINCNDLKPPLQVLFDNGLELRPEIMHYHLQLYPNLSKKHSGSWGLILWPQTWGKRETYKLTYEQLGRLN